MDLNSFHAKGFAGLPVIGDPTLPEVVIQNAYKPSGIWRSMSIWRGIVGKSTHEVLTTKECYHMVQTKPDIESSPSIK